jgi:hypothetical protein
VDERLLICWDDLTDQAEQGMGGAVGPVIEAQYGGRCRGCGDRWEPGDLIAYGEDEDGWLCSSCAA